MGFSSSIALDSLYPVGSFYYTTAAECPIAVLGVGTWVNVGTSLIITVNTNVPCKGNGKTLGLSDGSNNFGLLANNRTYGDYNGSTAYFNQSVGSSGHNDYQPNNGKSLGVTTDSTKSGIVGTITRGVLTLNIFQRQA